MKVYLGKRITKLSAVSLGASFEAEMETDIQTGKYSNWKNSAERTEQTKLSFGSARRNSKNNKFLAPNRTKVPPNEPNDN